NPCSQACTPRKVRLLLCKLQPFPTGIAFRRTDYPCRPNAITLSCKGRLPRRAVVAARRLPRPTRSGRSELQPTRCGGAGGAVRRRLRRRAKARRLLSACEGSWTALAL